MLRDFTPITQAVSQPNLLAAHPSLPAKSVKELTALAKARPGELVFASSGIGASSHLTMELFLLMTGTRMSIAGILALAVLLPAAQAAGKAVSLSKERLQECKYASENIINRSRLAELAAERIRLAESSGSFSILDSVGRALVRQSMHAQAERLYRRALAICEETVGAEHTDTASSLQAIGVTLAFQARYAEAEEMLRRALAAWILIRGPEHPYVASALNSIGGVLERQGNLSEANALRDRAKAILEQNQAKTRS